MTTKKDDDETESKTKVSTKAKAAEPADDGVKAVDGVLRDETGRNVGSNVRQPHTSGTFDATKNPGEPGSGTGADAPDPRDAGANVPKIRGEGKDEPLKVGDRVIVHTSTPINTLLTNPAIVTKLNVDGTINVEVSRDDGQVMPVTSVKNAMQQTPEPWWEHAAD